MMKNLMGAVLFFSVLWVCGCDPFSQGSGLNGTWRGTITEREPVAVELKLFERGSLLTGAFIVVGETGSNDVSKGRSIPIVQAEYAGNQLKFIVPIAGEVDDDAIFFELMIEGNKLTGSLNELRAGSDKLPIVFTKK